MRVGSGAILASFVALLCVMSPRTVAALSEDQRRQILSEAQQAYDQAISIVRSDPAEARRIFRNAATRFQFLVDDGVINGHLLYNLANANLQCGAIGQAILNYRRAERFLPGDPRLEGNLEYARSIRRSQIAASGERALGAALLSWHRRSAFGTRLVLFVVAYVAFWLVLIAARLAPRPRWRWVALGAAILVVPLGLSVAADTFAWGAGREGVLVSDEVILRKGNGDGFEPQFEEPLFQGVEFELIERRADWLNVRLPDGNTGWVREAQAALI
jgi:hypothetical protein